MTFSPLHYLTNTNKYQYNSYSAEYIWSHTEDILNFSFIFNGNSFITNKLLLETFLTDFDVLTKPVKSFECLVSNFAYTQNLFFLENLSFIHNLANNFGYTSDIEYDSQFLSQYQNVTDDFEIPCSDSQDGSYFDYMRTIPDCKLYYPEPFIASPSFLHEEIWFVHILHYNYWLWFFFISLIMFYFITFIHMVRWCNLRIKPKRETRGVSRSKCADLITACVPVSWALSIIISETVDATDYYDGFGTGEIVIGIRAYQWGWEYFYPKNIDLNYNVSPSYSSFIGNSIKYNNTSSSQIDANVLWKFYQKKNKTAQLNTPAHLLLSPNSKNSLFNIIDFSSVGNSISNDSTAFSKIHKLSKISSANITTELSSANLILSKIHNLYFSQNVINQETYQYGSTRQHNLSSLGSILPSFATLVDDNSFKKFFNYSLNTPQKGLFKPSETNFFNNQKEDKTVLNTTFFNNLLTHIDSSDRVTSVVGTHGNYLLQKFLTDFNTTKNSSITTDSNNKSNFFLTLNSSSNKKKVKIISKPMSTSMYDDLTSNIKHNFYSWNIFNFSKNYRFYDLKSNNLQFLSPDKNLRTSVNYNLNATSREFDSVTNLTSFFYSTLNMDTNTYTNFNNASSYWVNANVMSNIVNTNTTITSTYNPVASSSKYWNTLSYDKLNKYSTNDVPSIMRGKEELAPEYLFNTYWYSYYNNMNLNNNYNAILNNIYTSREFYLPSILEYAEYDFKNWQALEALEDSIWESAHSSFAQEDFTNIKATSNISNYYDKIQALYNANFRTKEGSKFKFKSKIAYRSLLNSISDVYSLPLYTDDIFINPKLVNLSNLIHFNVNSTIDNLEDNYENVKSTQLVFFKGGKNSIFQSFNYILPLPLTQVLDSFRPDFDENNWDTDYNVNLTNSMFLNTDTILNLTNPLKIRSSAKNSIVTYNAIQKVYKARFDDLRANINFPDFTNSFSSYPFLLETKTPYENLLKKHKESFYNSNFYKKTFDNNYSNILNVFLSLNTNFMDIPFLLSLKSDASRYLWFDWQARWSSIEVQPSSIAKYSLAGLPYTSKKFEYNTTIGDELSDSENYLTKISRIRKNYMPNWAYSPYFYGKLTNWFFYNNTDLFFSDLDVKSTKLLFKTSCFYWESNTPSLTKPSSNSTPSYSSLNRNNVVTWSPLSGVSSYYYNTSILIDILTKREYLYKDFYKFKANNTALPKMLTLAPNNNFLKEVQTCYMFLDPTTYSSEITRELLYNDNNFLYYSFLRDFLKISNNLFSHTPLNFNVLNNYFIYLFGYIDSYGTVKGNANLYKSQYRPMRKGITNMIRLQATNAIAMPTEIRLHILASSKDVIHSWAIPSAGIKIDCVPGYSSHRVAIFLQHGIFWGQCMEICGRYHHWMPIVVYFMKRDLFFLWCTHFMHYSDMDQAFQMTDRQLSDYLRLVSFDKTTWVNEMDRILY